MQYTAVNGLYQKQRRKVQCTLCPHQCIIHEGKYGICGVRRNLGGRIRSRNYGIVSSSALDPIEKKPLYHFYPGSNIFSIGSIGCNLHCNFCQNWQISQVCYPEELNIHETTIDVVLDQMQKYPLNIGMAFTYNEPTVWYEFMFDLAVEVKKREKKTAMITNGYINPEPLSQLLPLIDAFNVDLKGFTEQFYREMTGALLEPVKQTLLLLSKSEKHIEITNLVITGKNDKDEDFIEMVKWIAGELGPDTVLHLSRYFPRYKQNAHQTHLDTLEKFYHIARQYLNYVYIGNAIGIGQDTHCPSCGELLIVRSGYQTRFTNNYGNGGCLKCKKQILKHHL